MNATTARGLPPREGHPALITVRTTHSTCHPPHGSTTTTPSVHLQAERTGTPTHPTSLATATTTTPVRSPSKRTPPDRRHLFERFGMHWVQWIHGAAGPSITDTHSQKHSTAKGADVDALLQVTKGTNPRPPAPVPSTPNSVRAPISPSASLVTVPDAHPPFAGIQHRPQRHRRMWRWLQLSQAALKRGFQATRRAFKLPLPAQPTYQAFHDANDELGKSNRLNDGNVEVRNLSSLPSLMPTDGVDGLIQWINGAAGPSITDRHSQKRSTAKDAGVDALLSLVQPLPRPPLPSLLFVDLPHDLDDRSFTLKAKTAP
ncbi:hypothetical protein FRC00_011693 [Tulasnella sp. 408]|nr:hypothetical protein FRC00_011693 [Tulasnella sp. 408]